MNTEKLIEKIANEIQAGLKAGGVPGAVLAYLGPKGCRTDYAPFGDAIQASLRERGVPEHLLERIFYPGAGEGE